MHLCREVMCISPIRIRNPNLGNKSYLIQKLRDTTSEFINVPCGHCSECIAVRQMSVVQRCQMEELNNHLFFCTLTYNNESLPVITTSNGYDIRYADVRDVQNMMKRLRINDVFGRPFKYFGVSELGSLKARPHFHLIFSVKKFDSDTRFDITNLEYLMFHAVLKEWRRNYGSRRKPIYRPLCTYVRKMIRGRLKSNFDLHYVDPRTADGDTCDVPFYVTKYMLKPSEREQRLQQALKLNLDDAEYERIWSIVRSRSFQSLHFGYDGEKNVADYIKNCVRISRVSEDSPKFYNPFSGQSFPLSQYYQKIGSLYTTDDALYFNAKQNVKDNVYIDDRHISEKLRSIEVFDKNVRMVDSHDESYIFDELNG